MSTHRYTFGGTYARAIAAAATALVLAVPSMSVAQTPTHNAGSLVASRAVVPELAEGVRPGMQPDGRWQPWLGCWKPEAPGSDGMAAVTSSGSDVPLVCVIPANDANAESSVNIVTVKDGKVVARDTITVTGQNVARTKQGCNGVEKASWSADGHRLYLTSDFTCSGGVERTSSGLFAISPNGEWVSVQAVDAGGNTGVRAVHYADAGVPSTVPPEISSALGGNELAVSTARAAAGTGLAGTDIVEASHQLDSAVVAAWIIDRGQSFGVDAKELIALADAGVPSNVTDAMVAVSYPAEFALNQPADESVAGISTTAQSSDLELAPDNGRDINVYMAPSYAPYGFAPYGFTPFDYYGYGYSPYRYYPYGAFFSPYGGFGPAYGGLYWHTPAPVVIVGGHQPAPPRGFAVKGHGYTQTQPATGGSTAVRRPPSHTGQSSSPSRGTARRNSPPPQPVQHPASSGRKAHPRP